MISRRFLLGAAPVALLAPAIAKSLPAAAPAVPTTWGAGLEAVDMAALPDVMAYFTRVGAGLMTVDEVRRAEGFTKFDLESLLRGQP